MKLHDQWITLRKHKFRQSKTDDQKRAEFIYNLNKLFDISEKNHFKREIEPSDLIEFEQDPIDDLSYSDHSDLDPDYVPEGIEHGDKKKSCLSRDLCMALDRNGLSNAKATMIVAAAAASFGQQINDLNLSVSTVRRTRIKIREDEALNIKSDFSLSDYWIVHWDGKLLPDLTDDGTGIYFVYFIYYTFSFINLQAS